MKRYFWRVGNEPLILPLSIDLGLLLFALCCLGIVDAEVVIPYSTILCVSSSIVYMYLTYKNIIKMDDGETSNVDHNL